MIFLILLLAVFFSINMGAASFAAAFGPAYGGRVINYRNAGLLFIIFVLIGSVLFGSQVSITLGRNIVATEFLTESAIAVILFTAGMSMFVANLMKIPQSTSLVTVAAIAGVGAYHSQVNLATLANLAPFWILLPLLSYLATKYIAGFIYPPTKRNLWIYEKFINHKEKLKKFVIISGCYCALSVGSNNVANVVGPLMGLGPISVFKALFVFAGFYGLGAFIFRAPIETAGNKFVPLGLTTATIISLVSGTLMIFASAFGVPQSFVMLQMGAIIAIATLKHGDEETLKNPLTKRTLYTWTINPVITFFISWILIWMVNEYGHGTF